MSSVVISGDVSGSVTLQAPSAAGTTVLTLPATSGTVVTGPSGVTQVASGGTGASTLTANNVILGNGTSAVQFVAPGSSGNVLTSNGTTWTSAAAAGGNIQTQLFTSPGTWTKPSSCTQVRVTVIGGGGAAGNGPGSGLDGQPGGSSSFGPLVTATGGSGGPGAAPGAPGTGTVSAPATSIAAKGIPRTAAPAASNLLVSIGLIAGAKDSTGVTTATAYSATTPFMAGIGGVGPNIAYAGGGGGFAVAIVPVSAPVAVTVGTGGASNPVLAASGAVGGAVLVEFVG